MLYTVKLQYCVVVDANSATQAYNFVRQKIHDDPSSFITRVEAGGGQPKKSSLMKMFLFGK